MVVHLYSCKVQFSPTTLRGKLENLNEIIAAWKYHLLSYTPVAFMV